MLAAVIAVGSELLGPDRVDSNSLRLTSLLERYGFELLRKVVVGDSEEEIARAVDELAGRVDLIVVSGGLGPTSDDVTREGVARALGVGLTLDEGALTELERRFARLGWRMPEANRRQAMVIAGATLLANPLGSAPGLRVASRQTELFLFPGVPREIDGMMAAHLEPWLADRAPGVARERAVIKVAGLPESVVEERIAPAYAEFGRESITVLASRGEIRIEAVAAGKVEERRARLAAMSERLAQLVGDAAFTRDEESLEAVVLALLRAQHATLAVGESCTGGLLATRLTAVPGSSDVVLGGIVAYANRIKETLLGVDPAMLEQHGAVSEPVARAMALGAVARFGATLGVGITGIAGPGGGSEEKPVGTVHLAVAEGSEVEHRHLRLPGDREGIRWFASQIALDMLRRRALAKAATTVVAGEPVG